MSLEQIELCASDLIEAVSAKNWNALPELLERHRALIQASLEMLDSQNRQDVATTYSKALWIARSHRAFLEQEFNHNRISAAIMSAYDVSTLTPQQPLETGLA